MTVLEAIVSVNAISLRECSSSRRRALRGLIEGEGLRDVTGVANRAGDVQAGINGDDGRLMFKSG